MILKDVKAELLKLTLYEIEEMRIDLLKTFLSWNNRALYSGIAFLITSVVLMFSDCSKGGMFFLWLYSGALSARVAGLVIVEVTHRFFVKLMKKNWKTKTLNLHFFSFY